MGTSTVRRVTLPEPAPKRIREWRPKNYYKVTLFIVPSDSHLQWALSLQLIAPDTGIFRTSDVDIQCCFSLTSQL